MKQYFTKEDIQRATKHTKRCSIALAIREMQINITMRSNYTPIKMAKNQMLVKMRRNWVTHIFLVEGGIK